MRIKIFAILLLLLLVGLPVWLYWYIFSVHTSGIIFLADRDQIFRVKLVGNFSFEYFPLFDKVFHYESTCQGSCIFRPVPPLTYTLTLTASGYTPITDDIALSFSEEKKYRPHFTPALSYQKIDHITEDPLYMNLLRTDILTHLGPRNDLIGIDQYGTVYVSKNLGDRTLIGKMEKENFSRIFTLPFVPQSVRLDGTRSVFIFEKSDNTSLLVTLDGLSTASYPSSRGITLASKGSTWSVSTASGSSLLDGDLWIDNPRFTYAIDLSDRYRVGYVDKADRERLSLLGYREGVSLFFLLDRFTGESLLVEQGRDIIGFFTRNSQAYMLDTAGDVYTLSITSR